MVMVVGATVVEILRLQAMATVVVCGFICERLRCNEEWDRKGSTICGGGGGGAMYMFRAAVVVAICDGVLLEWWCFPVYSLSPPHPNFSNTCKIEDKKKP
ncbi:hypothetical protein QVD17_02762 [Tagetes erecta]|uniref:Uncharacterized protein n=1 Tax=Tagetes erecta TaxID=13708 RepID=A0AAD8L9S8_TARER|nr:hypothetical protein QVD17_02762 [Tagetes erecta]